MYNIRQREGSFDESVIPTDELIELLECKLDKLKQARDEDSSWNYGIEELEEQIKQLKENL